MNLYEKCLKEHGPMGKVNFGRRSQNVKNKKQYRQVGDVIYCDTCGGHVSQGSETWQRVGACKKGTCWC